MARRGEGDIHITQPGTRKKSMQKNENLFNRVAYFSETLLIDMCSCRDAPLNIWVEGGGGHEVVVDCIFYVCKKTIFEVSLKNEILDFVVWLLTLYTICWLILVNIFFIINLLSPRDALNNHFTSLKKRLNFPITKSFRMKLPMKLVYQYMAIFFAFSPTSNHLHSLQVENCDSNPRLVVDEDDNSKFRPERVNSVICPHFQLFFPPFLYFF